MIEDEIKILQARTISVVGIISQTKTIEPLYAEHNRKFAFVYYYDKMTDTLSYVVVHNKRSIGDIMEYVLS